LPAKFAHLIAARSAGRSGNSLRMLSVVFDFESEPAGSLTDILEGVTSFPNLTYLEICFKDTEYVVTNHSFVRPQVQEFRALPKLISLSIYSPTHIPMKDCYQQLATFLDAALAGASLQHLLLPPCHKELPRNHPWRAAYEKVLRLHAPTLLSMRVDADTIADAIEVHGCTFSKLGYLRLFTDWHFNDQYEAIMSHCPNLTVFWMDNQWDRTLGNILSRLAPLVHTLVSHFSWRPEVLPRNTTLRHVYLMYSYHSHNRRSSGLKLPLQAPNMQTLLAALPSLQTCVFVPHTNRHIKNRFTPAADSVEPTSIASDNPLGTNTSSSAAAAAAGHHSQLTRFQPYVSDSYYEQPILYLPDANHITPSTRIYTPEFFVMPRNHPATPQWVRARVEDLVEARANVRKTEEAVSHARFHASHLILENEKDLDIAKKDLRFRETLSREDPATAARNDKLAPYYAQMHLAPSWTAWETHIGRQLVAADLSILSPCGSCADSSKRPGMFDVSRLERRAPVRVARERLPPHAPTRESTRQRSQTVFFEAKK
jgi:hypothetical protein